MESLNQIYKGLLAVLLVLMLFFSCKDTGRIDPRNLSADDSNAPLNPSVTINNDSENTTTRSVTLSLFAFDDTGVTGYYLSEENIQPQSTDRDWNPVSSSSTFSSSVTYNLSAGDGLKTVYAWYKDGSGNVSAESNDTITLNAGVAPTNPSVLIENDRYSSASFQVNLQLSAMDDTAVSAYYASESNIAPSATDSGWTSVVASSFFNSSVEFSLSREVGTKTVYVWFKDASGNISESASDSIEVAFFYLPDTGQTDSNTATFGEDSDYLINSPSYTDNGDGTITDHVTGLVWQMSDDDTKRSLALAIDYCTNNRGELSGTGWRLPTPRELSSILDFGTRNPAINSMFNGTDNWTYWTYRDSSESNTFTIHFSQGAVGLTNNLLTNYVRCVQGPTTTTSLVDNGDGTITDELTKLMWQKAEGEKKTWEQALTYCEAEVNLAGHIDWRLPNIKELLSIQNEYREEDDEDNNNKLMFPSVAPSELEFWSSTTEDSLTTNAWTARFLYVVASTSLQDKSSTMYVRCVRGRP